MPLDHRKCPACGSALYWHKDSSASEDREYVLLCPECFVACRDDTSCLEVRLDGPTGEVIRWHPQLGVRNDEALGAVGASHSG